jgi:DNA-binding PadR family transcriptional regulator
MSMQRKTKTRWAVLKAIAELGTPHGLRICRRTRLKTGTVYPILKQFTSNGLLTRIVEEIDSDIDLRPPRFFYELTPVGIDALNEYEVHSVQRRWGEAYA